MALQGVQVSPDLPVLAGRWLDGVDQKVSQGKATCLDSSFLRRRETSVVRARPRDACPSEDGEAVVWPWFGRPAGARFTPESD
jgi:hypothetical protein